MNNKEMIICFFLIIGLGNLLVFNLELAIDNIKRQLSFQKHHHINFN